MRETSGAGRRDLAIYVAVALAIGAALVLLQPPIELTDRNRTTIFSLAAIVILAVGVPAIYLLGRFSGRERRIAWLAVGLVSLAALAAVVWNYERALNQYSVEIDGDRFVIGTDAELTEIGQAARAAGDMPRQILANVGGASSEVWHAEALRAHGEYFNRYYYLIQALVTLSGVALIGVWRSSGRSRQDTVGLVPASRAVPPSPAATAQRRFRVAFSYPGEVRERASGIATELASTLSRETVFYDKWYAAELARPDLDLYLQQIYKQHADLLVIFLCAEYERKEWCGLEWRGVRDFIKGRESARIMLLRLDETPIAGVLSIDGYLDIREVDDADVATAILARLQSIDSTPATA